MEYIGWVASAGWDIPVEVLPLECFGPWAIAGAKFTALSKATAAPPSSRVFISVPRDEFSGHRHCRCIAGRQVDRRRAASKFGVGRLDAKT
jgi:hypothetical protein